MLSVSWDLIPNTKEYNNWYRILTHLPPFVYLKLLMPTGEIVEKQMYRGDVNTKLHLFISNNQIWQGLSTTFTQWNVDEYDDTLEPTLESTIITQVNEELKVIVVKNGIEKQIDKSSLQQYINLGWILKE